MKKKLNVKLIIFSIKVFDLLLFNMFSLFSLLLIVNSVPFCLFIKYFNVFYIIFNENDVTGTSAPIAPLA
jgi:hypothetical protein